MKTRHSKGLKDLVKQPLEREYPNNGPCKLQTSKPMGDFVSVEEVQYWVEIAGVSSRPLTKEELFSKYATRLAADTPCSRVGENKWRKLSDYFPDWESPLFDGTGDSTKTFHARKPIEAVSRYPLLRLMSRLLPIFALLAGLAAIVVVAVGITSGGVSGLMLVIGGISGGAFNVLIYLTLAEAIQALLDIEENTRKTLHQSVTQ